MRARRIAHIAGVDLTHRFLLLGQLRHFRQLGYDVSAISAPGSNVQAIEAEGIRHIAWPHITRSWDVAADQRAFRALVRILRREQFDLVHTHNPKPGVMGRIAARVAGVPRVVNTVHGLYAMPEDPWAKRAGVLPLEAIASRFSDHEFYQSEEDFNWAQRLRLAPAGRTTLLGNGTNLTIFSPTAVSMSRREELRRELDIPSGAPVVGAVGRLVVEKGYRELFAAAENVRSKMREARFVVVGSSDLDKSDAILEDEIGRAGQHIVFTGWRDDVRDIMAMMDVFVLASWREGLPRSAIEAAAMGKPLVLTDIRGCREVARHGREGILVPARDAERLAEAIEVLVEDEHLRSRMGQAARERAEERFDEEAVFRKISSVYERLLPSGLSQPAAARGSRRIRRGGVPDAPALARLHRDSLPDAFLPTLGEPFLRRMYRALVLDREAVVLVAEEESEVVGFVAGVPSVAAFYRRFFLRQGIAAAVAAAPRLVRPVTLRRLYETARYPNKAPSLPDAELLSLAVAGDRRGRGLGRELAEQLVRELARMGVARVKVVVDATNKAANALYANVGFGKVTSIDVHAGTSSNVWIYECHSSPRSA